MSKGSRTGPIDLTTFVGDDSWSFFEIMKINAEGFITKPIEEWPLYDEFTRAKSIVENLCVVNDAAERSVKLVSDFLSSAWKENQWADSKWSPADSECPKCNQ